MEGSRPHRPEPPRQRSDVTRDKAADPTPEGGRALPPEAIPENDPASFAEELAEGTDLSEFDDLLDSLRHAMRLAEEDRLQGRKTGVQERAMLEKPAQARPGTDKAVPGIESPDEARPVQAQPPAPQAAAPRQDERDRAEGEEDGYPDWLTKGLASEAEVQGAAERPGGPESPGDLEWPGEPERPSELEWPGVPYVDVPSGGDQHSLSKRRHVYRSYESSRISAHAFRCRVTLSTNGHEYVGEAEGPSVPGVRAEIAAKATLDALCSAENGRVILSLMTARVLRFSDMPLVVVSVYGMNDEEINRLVGVSVVENSEEQAAILATLQATDRWIAGVIRRAQE